MIYKKFEGNSASVQIENIDEKDPYTGIGAKAFLSCKDVYEIRLPDTVCEIGNWAFAHMKELKRIIVPANNIAIGKDAFLDCDNLKEVVVYPVDFEESRLSYLMASCITVLKSDRLLDFKLAAEQNNVWSKLYDEELLYFISQDDAANFQPVIVGWFNDEGEEEQLQRYVKKVKSDKINICFLRLKYDSHMEDKTREMLLTYIKKHINPSGDTWEIIKHILSSDIEYTKLVVNNGLLNDELISELISFFNSNNASTEIVAYLVMSITGNNESIDKQFEL